MKLDLATSPEEVDVEESGEGDRENLLVDNAVGNHVASIGNHDDVAKIGNHGNHNDVAATGNHGNHATATSNHGNHSEIPMVVVKTSECATQTPVKRKRKKLGKFKFE